MKQLCMVLACLLSCSLASAEITSRSKDIVIEQPRDLPEAAQTVGQAMEIRSLGSGRTYLYIEQQTLSRIAILDVTDPAHIKSVGMVKIEAPGTYDFVRSLGGATELISFRDDKSAAVLDFRNPKAPTLIRTNTLQQATRIESIGDTGLLLNNVPRLNADSLPHDYQVVDCSDPRAPQLLLKIGSVEKRLTNPDTGTTFLLGSDGLIVIRQPKIEEAYHTQESATN
jgi:hypothetical protein